MRNARVIGVDPGKAVGLAVLEPNDRFTAVELTYEQAEDRLWELLRVQVPTVIGMERFTFTSRSVKMTRQYDALYLIGMARFATRLLGGRFLLQGASDAWEAGGPDVIRTLGWWQRGAADHVHRACSQVILALQTADHRRLVRLLTGDDIGPGTVSS